MLLDNLTYSQINTLVNDACRKALSLSKNNIDQDLFLSLFDQLNNGQISLNDLINKTSYQSNDAASTFCQLKFIKSILVDMLFCLKKTNEHYSKQCTLKLNHKKSLKQINIGINGMPTEYIDHHITIKLQAFLACLEKTNSIEELPQFIADILLPHENITKKYTNIDMQLFYADTIYSNFEAIYAEVFKTNQILNIDNNHLPCIHLYTWVGGDQDGIPFTTSNHTEAILNAFSVRIKEHYCKDLAALLKKYDDVNLERIAGLLQMASNPNEIISLLNAYSYEDFPEIYLFNLKLKSFGFHYIELEFRENSRVIHEAMDQIIGQNTIKSVLDIDKAYRELTEDERDLLLTELMRQEGLPRKIINDFLSDHADYFKQKNNEHSEKSVYELHEVDHAYLQKYNAKRFLEWFYVIKKYHHATNKFGIAEAKSRTDALAVLFCAKGVVGEKNIHVVLQPEGPHGAEILYATISTLYHNEIYMAHLRNHGNYQYMIFGPSDTCKQGGKGMHISNMQLAKMHRLVAEKYGLELITNIVVGHEHARCNNVLVENLNEFAVAQGSEIRYMMAGLNEMRHLLLTPLMTRNFFKTIYDFQFLSPSEGERNMEVYQNHFDFWIKSVRGYEDAFFNHTHLPTFLKDVARLDILKYVTKDHRPQSRKYWLEYAEIDPTQIRAVAWTRSLQLSGLHYEWLGANILEEHSNEFLTNKFKEDIAFNNYIKSTAYACARTNIDMTWRALGREPPSSFIELTSIAQSEVIDSVQFLANIHICFLKSLRLINKTVYQRDLLTSELFGMDRISLLEFWPDLAEEVRAREQQLDEYYKIIMNRAQEDVWLQNKNVLNSIYSTFINESNTATSYYLTAHENPFSLSKNERYFN